MSLSAGSAAIAGAFAESGAGLEGAVNWDSDQ